MKICKKNVNVNMFSFTFYANSHASVIFVRILLKFSPKCRTKEIGNDIHYFGKFLLSF